MTSDLNSLTLITYVGLSFWLVNASTFNLKGEGEGQRGHVDLRASPQVKTQLLFLCQRKVGNKMMCHPLHSFFPRCFFRVARTSAHPCQMADERTAAGR